MQIHAHVLGVDVVSFVSVPVIFLVVAERGSTYKDRLVVVPLLPCCSV